MSVRYFIYKFILQILKSFKSNFNELYLLSNIKGSSSSKFCL